jgi:hypothetical protein
VTNQTSRFRVPPSFTHTRRIGWYHASILLFLGLLSAANPPVANAQQDPLESIGIPPFSAQIPVEEDTSIQQLGIFTSRSRWVHSYREEVVQLNTH